MCVFVAVVVAKPEKKCSLDNINGRLHLARKYAEKDIQASFSPKMGAIMLIVLQMFFATLAVLKIGKYIRIFPSYSWEEIFDIIAITTRLDENER